jgi:DNA recombination protein RmuC
MTDTFFLVSFILLIVLVLLVVFLLLRKPGRDPEQPLQLQSLRDALDKLERTLREEFGRSREEAAFQARQGRDETAGALRASAESLTQRMTESSQLQTGRLDAFSNQLIALTGNMQERLEAVRGTVDQRLSALQEDNTRKLEQMRETVDEKLHATLEQRLGESFRLVSERLERVAQGLGEMQTLASGVGDLKKVLTNIKARGTWGEVQLGALLEQVLTPEQYGRNVATRDGSNDRVEFAIRLPGHDGAPVWLPIDAKFPQEDYQRLLEAQEQANAVLVDEAGRLLEQRIRTEAKTIREKYVDPPGTTDFAIMFLPTEGLYAEVTRRTGLMESLQRDYRVVVAGPINLAAILNSLQMGFRTLAIEKRSSEVWALLGAVKTGFSRFGEMLDRTKKKLDEASTSIDSAASRSRTIEKKLREVAELPAPDAAALLGEPEDNE